jgi:hypothetical protein
MSVRALVAQGIEQRFPKARYIYAVHANDLLLSGSMYRQLRFMCSTYARGVGKPRVAWEPIGGVCWSSCSGVLTVRSATQRAAVAGQFPPEAAPLDGVCALPQGALITPCP